MASGNERQWARQFAIEGSKDYSSIFVFKRTSGKFVPSLGKCAAILEAKLYEDIEWRTLLFLDLNIKRTDNLNCLLTYDNDPDGAFD